MRPLIKSVQDFRTSAAQTITDTSPLPLKRESLPGSGDLKNTKIRAIQDSAQTPVPPAQRAEAGPHREALAKGNASEQHCLHRDCSAVQAEFTDTLEQSYPQILGYSVTYKSSFTHFICFQKSVLISKCWITLNPSPRETSGTDFTLVCPFLFRSSDCFMNSSDNATHYSENALLSVKLRHFTCELPSRRHDTNLGTKFHQNQTTKRTQECTRKQSK